MAAPDSVLYNLLLGVQAAVVSLNLVDWNNAAVPTYLRKLPVVREALESVPCTVVCFDDRPETTELADAEGNSFVWYRVEVGIVLPNDGSATQYLDYLTGWRQEERRLFQLVGTTPMPPQIINLNADPKATYQRSGFGDNYDVNLLSVKALSYEPAS